MAKKNKVNPNKIHISSKDYDVEQIVREITEGLTFRAWALVLAALADFTETTTESLLKFWEDVNDYSKDISHRVEIDSELKYIEKVAGLSMPFKEVTSEGIRTLGDLNRFRRRNERNALYAAFALMASPIIKKKLFEEEEIRIIFRKAYDMDDEIAREQLSLRDIQEALIDEFELLLTKEENGAVRLTHVLMEQPK